MLSAREKQFLRRFAAGKTDAQIAGHFGCTAEQVAEQRARIFQKLKLTSEAQIAQAAAELAHWPTYKGAS